jgi:hypothetical protein
VAVLWPTGLLQTDGKSASSGKAFGPSYRTVFAPGWSSTHGDGTATFARRFKTRSKGWTWLP